MGNTYNSPPEASQTPPTPSKFSRPQGFSKLSIRSLKFRQDSDGTETGPLQHELSEDSSGGGGRVAPEAVLEEEEDEDGPLPPELTEDHKVIIKTTWKIIEAEVAKIGVVLFIGLFETHPDIQEVFMPFKGMEIEEMRRSKKFQAHALKVMGFVEKAVRRIDQPEQLDKLIRDNGHKHVHYGALIDQIDAVGGSFLDAIKPAMGDDWNPEVEEAWTVLMQNLAYYMKKAMREKIKS